MCLQVKLVHPQGIAFLDGPDSWLKEVSSLLKVVGDYWPGQTAADYGPPHDLRSLRMQLQCVAPGFTDLANKVLGALLSKFDSIIVEGFGLAGMEQGLRMIPSGMNRPALGKRKPQQCFHPVVL